MREKLNYRADIDGLRAIAVLGVVLYHYGASWLPGGFTGVDVFFVISGYLITSILRKQIEAGTFSILAFYDRRIRRIVPALLVMLATTLVLGWFILMPGDYANLGESSAYATLGLGNLYFFWNTGYFDRAAELQPLLHTWSLGVEEQFYLVWPLALWLGLTFVKSRTLVVVAGAAALALLFAYSVWTVASDPKAAFYLPLPRAWEFLIGGALVFARPIQSTLTSGFVATAGVAAIVWSLATITISSSFPGWGAVYASVGAACLIYPKKSNWISIALSWRPVVAIGLISYSLYLWHWPILVMFRYYNNSAFPSPIEALALGLLSAALAAGSWRYIEQPFRHGRASTRLLPVLTTVFVVCVFGLTITGMSGIKSRVPASVDGMDSLETMWEWQCPQPKEFLGGTCAFGAEWESADRRMILWGESHAEHFTPLLEQVVPPNTSVLLVRGCLPIVDNVIVARFAPDYPDYSVICAESSTEVLAFIAETSPDTIILAAAWSAYRGELFRPGETHRDAAAAPGLVYEGLDALASRLESKGAEVVIIADVPQRTGDPVPCAIGAYSGLYRAGCTAAQLATPRSYFDEVQGPTYAAIRSAIARSPMRNGIFPGDGMCEDLECISSLGGEPLYRDSTHLRRNLSHSTANLLAKQIGLSSAFD